MTSNNDPKSVNSSEPDLPMYLVLNTGSSTIKFSIFDKRCREVVSGLCDKIGTEYAQFEWRSSTETNKESIVGCGRESVLERLVEIIASLGVLANIVGVGHRIVHGGEFYSKSTLITTDVLKNLERTTVLAPLHNPIAISAVKFLQHLLPDVKHVAVFDTAFHQTMEKQAFLYAIPYELYEKHNVRRYGFHGTSHRYVSQEVLQRLSIADIGHVGLDIAKNNALITVHLGNGCSAAAIKNGRSVDTTMGLTPLEGLVMGTRSGDVDPGLHQILASELGMDLDAITEMLNRSSGLLGLSGISNDMRSLCDEAQKGNERAMLAIDVFCFRLARQIGALSMSLTRIDALVFTGGIGENSAFIRQRVVDRLGLLGFSLENELNMKNGHTSNGRISTRSAPLVYVIPTQEDLMIAKDTIAICL